MHSGAIEQQISEALATAPVNGTTMNLHPSSQH